jgi:hypothetical protein
MPVVVEPGFFVIVLTGEAQIVGNAFYINLGIPEGVIGCRPNHKTAGRHDLLRRPLVVVLVPVIMAAYLDKERIGAPLGSRCPTIGPQLNSRCIILTDQTFIRVYKIGPDSVNGLALAKRADDRCQRTEIGTTDKTRVRELRSLIPTAKVGRYMAEGNQETR